MKISNNTLRHHLNNVYFIWGRGKTTVANLLRKKYGFYIYSTDLARDRLFLLATPEKQPYMCRDYISEYGVSSFWELPTEIIEEREVHFLREVTPMMTEELSALSNKHSIIICEGDIDYEQIIEISDKIVYLRNCGTKFDWFNRSDHDSLDYIRNRTDINEMQKQQLIDQAYNSASADESRLGDFVTAHNIKVITWNDEITPEETADEVGKYFGFEIDM